MTGKRARKGRSNLKLKPPTGGMSSTAASSSLSLKNGSASILRLPPQALRLIVEGILDDYYPPTAWFASLATICKTLLPYVEAVLYDDVLLETCPMARTYLHSVIKSQRPHRAAAVRSLALNIRKATSVVQPFKKAFAKLTNLYDLALVSDTVELFEALLVTPPHLRILRVGGRNYPACFHDILTAHSRIDDLSIEFVCNISSAKGSKTQRTRLLSDGALLPSIKTLSLSAGTFSPTLVRYSYPITSLELLKPSHEDTTYALRLFSQTLVSFSILKLITSDCPSRCFWPTWALHCVRLPKLRILEMHHQWGSDLQLDGGEFDYPDVDAMEVPGLGKSCPELETIIWAVEHGVPENLYEDWSEGDAPIQHYVRTLVDALPSFARLAVFDPEEATTTSDGLFYGDIWTRDNMDSDEPENDVIDAPRWKKEACAAAGSRRKSERVGNRRLRHA